MLQVLIVVSIGKVRRWQQTFDEGLTEQPSVDTSDGIQSSFNTFSFNPKHDEININVKHFTAIEN